MQKSIDYLADEKILRATITGRRDAADYAALLVELRVEAGSKQTCRILVELQSMESAINQLDLHDLPEVNKHFPATEKLHVAITHRHMVLQDLDDLHYFCHRINAEGFDVRLFASEETARAWLCA